MAKKGMLQYAEDGGIADDSGKAEKRGAPARESAGAGEMYALDLFERAFQPPFGGDKTEMERKRGQLKAFKELMAYCQKEG